MKSIKSQHPFFISMYIILILILTAGCNNKKHEMITVINEDGSSYRKFSIHADSAFMAGDTAHNRFPFFIDSTWHITWSHDSLGIDQNWPVTEWEHTNKIRPKVTAQKDFHSVDSMLVFDYLNHGDWQDIAPVMDYTKQFKWFYTYHTYTEIFPKIETFDKIPLTDYLTEEEIKFYFQGGDFDFKGMNGIEMNEYLTSIEKKFDEWFNKNSFEETYEVIAQNFEYVEDTSVLLDRFLQAKEEIWSILNKKKKPHFELKMKHLDDYFHTKAFSKLEDDRNEKLDKELEERVSFIEYFDQDFQYKLLLPGKLIFTNSSQIQGDTISWEIDAYRFAMDDYVLMAKSRTVNIWAFIVSAIIVAFAVGSYFIKVKKK